MDIDMHTKELLVAKSHAKSIVHELQYRRYKNLGMTLNQARSIVVILEREIEQSLNEMPSLDRKDLGFIQARQLIRAIQSYIKRTGVSLIVAKNRIDQARDGIVFQLKKVSHDTR